MMTGDINPSQAIGRWFPGWGNPPMELTKGATVEMIRGKLAMVDTSLTPDGFKPVPATANQRSPIWAIPTDVSNDSRKAGTKFTAITDGFGTLNVVGTVEPFSAVQNDNTAAGKVKAFVLSDVTASPSEATIETALLDPSRLVGICFGHDGEAFSGSQTAVVDNETNGGLGIAVIKLRGAMF